jgi:hypothetical protein
MFSARLKYYYDLTRYNLVFSLVVGFFRGVNGGIITFGTFGMMVGLICYLYFQSNQYYFYYNLGIAKMELIAITWIVNIFIAALGLLILW